VNSRADREDAPGGVAGERGVVRAVGLDALGDHFTTAPACAAEMPGRVRA
jgi:hypothetical protein